MPKILAQALKTGNLMPKIPKKAINRHYIAYLNNTLLFCLACSRLTR